MMSDIKFLYEKYKESGKVSTDTRSITPGSVFFSLRGDKFNANEFAAEALSKGASYAVVDEERWVKDDRYILVDDTQIDLQHLARHHREQLTIPVIALTGSNGKTTTKELLTAVLGTKYKVAATKGNLNNHIGVPLTLLSIDLSAEIAVVEMGANHVGEIAALCKMANPSHGLITNIGKAHIGTFGGFENIVRGKSELYQHLISGAGTVWINSTDSVLSNMSKRFKEPLFYPAQGDYYHCQLVSADPFVKLKTENDGEINTHLIGAYNFENIAAALCVAKYFGIDPDQAGKAVEAYTPNNMRSQMVEKNSNTIILDAYNANPSSMEVAIHSLAQMKGKKRIAILGDMYELEAETEKEHRRVAELLQSNHIDEAYLCGKFFYETVKPTSSIKTFESKSALLEFLKKSKFENAIILLKASRGMALETVLDFI